MGDARLPEHNGKQDKSVAVGTEVTLCPPHRSLRAAFPHKAPASGE